MEQALARAGSRAGRRHLPPIGGSPGGLDGFDPRRPIHVSVPAQHRPRIPGAVLHRSTDLELAKVTTREGISVTGLARTVLDVAATERNPQVALRALDAVRRRPHHLPWHHLRSV